MEKKWRGRRGSPGSDAAAGRGLHAKRLHDIKERASQIPSFTVSGAAGPLEEKIRLLQVRRRAQPGFILQ